MARAVIFNSKPYDETYLAEANEAADAPHSLEFLEPRLTPKTKALAEGYEVICPFVHAEVDREVISHLVAGGLQHIALRSAGFNHVDLQAAAEHDVTVTRVPDYSPNAVAEHAVTLALTLNRRIHRAYSRVRESNFSLHGLLGFDLNDKTVGVIGTGKIGAVTARIFQAGFGCRVIAYDIEEDTDLIELGVEYVPLETLLGESHVISLHCPLNDETHHMIDADAIADMRDGVMLINTSRGGLIDTTAVIDGLKSGKVGHLGLDVYEEEADIFYEDLSNRILPDDQLARLLTFPNVLITSHQAFFTQEALVSIAETTIENITKIEACQACENVVEVD